MGENKNGKNGGRVVTGVLFHPSHPSARRSLRPLPSVLVLSRLVVTPERAELRRPAGRGQRERRDGGMDGCIIKHKDVIYIGPVCIL